MQYNKATLLGQPIRLVNLFFSGDTKAEIPQYGSYFYQPKKDIIVKAGTIDGVSVDADLPREMYQALLVLLREHTRLHLDKWTGRSHQLPQPSRATSVKM